MKSVAPTAQPVNFRAARPGPGQPSKQTAVCIRTVNRAIVHAALVGQDLPSDATLGAELQVSERTVRAMRLDVLGVNRWELRDWQQQRLANVPFPRRAERTLICTTPFAGLWSLVPQLLQSGCVQAAEKLQVLGRACAPFRLC
jgi:hypothetical protein